MSAKRRAEQEIPGTSSFTGDAASPSSPNETPARKKRGGRLPGAQSFTRGDKMRAFAVIRKIRPSDTNAWRMVAVEYNKDALVMNRRARDGEFLRKFFTDLLVDGYGKSSGELADDAKWDVKYAKEIMDGNDDNQLRLQLTASFLSDPNASYQEDEEAGEEDDTGDDMQVGDAENVVEGDDVALAAAQLSQNFTAAMLATPDPMDFQQPLILSTKPSLQKIKPKTPSDNIPFTPQSLSVNGASEMMSRQVDVAVDRDRDTHILGRLVASVEKEMQNNGRVAMSLLESQLARADARLDKLEGRNEKLEYKNERLEKENSQLKDEIRELRSKIAILEAQHTNGNPS
ncbi:Protein of unknown function [Pyronema omphalodes CBS 100304]|uniref:Uncharacterized protein n=1 Tax=Pyronema omphalodes (strain CBS 100304) TaxID=1076935 RepID=U4LVS5_PYROM|nr:Protein of unknown function [Pyronema omphalodes CBS 100304]